MKQKKFRFSSDLLTFVLVAVVYAVVAYLLYGGNLTRQFSNMLIPISVYIVLAVSLNLVVGLLGELSLGHAGFMSVGLFSGCLVSIALVDVLPMPVRLPLSMLIGGLYGTTTVADAVSGYDASMLLSVLLYLSPPQFCCAKRSCRRYSCTGTST